MRDNLCQRHGKSKSTTVLNFLVRPPGLPEFVIWKLAPPGINAPEQEYQSVMKNSLRSLLAAVVAAPACILSASHSRADTIYAACASDSTVR